ncbi:hypothetical protein [Aeromonas veronii]|uniref:hypothetical protein n=1 Tax=Aeromonas veronii TaxID=654 RepID=UPI00191F7B78|nr:hypothetical protein [Aeromonas veronii]MBL0480757.1 hypothetical protein [Aeromonas veronii]
MRITSLLAGSQVQLLMPPVVRYRCVIFLLLLVSWGVVAASLWDGWGAMALLNWVGVVFGGITGIMVSLPRSWQPWRLAELGWDEQHIYLLNGSKDEALALPRNQLVALERERRVGHDGQWLDFSLDLQLSEEELAAAMALLDLKAGELHLVSPSVYRFGFKRAWHGRRMLAQRLSDLQAA